jgi:hypothetical protein
MRLYDAVRPALPDDVYRVRARTSLSRTDLAVGDVEARFTLDGPRFALPATEVVAVHPPRNAQGRFDEVLPHLVLGRRTLPWERELDPSGVIPPPPAPDPPDPEPRPLAGGTPWLGLLLFVDDPTRSEVAVLPAPVPLSTVVTDAQIRARLHLAGADPLVEAIEVDAALLRRIAPSKDEVQLCSHVRQVNVDDRELAAGDSDGWFAVVMANRLPTPGLRHRACLVSLEQRSDVIFPAGPRTGDALPSGKRRLVLLHTWTFTAAPARPGGGSFREIAEALDSGLIGRSTPNVTDTGHRALTLQDRSGTAQTVWYRGPLVARPLVRDPLGPYHSADQARRVSPETGAEDISYAAAFEAGRLLGAADGRLAQDLMAWRRAAYREAARRGVVERVWSDVPALTTPPEQAVADGMVAPVSLTMFERAGAGAGDSADLTLAQTVRSAPGLDPRRLATAWSVSVAHAARLVRVEDAAAAAPPDPATDPATADPATADPATEEPDP